MTRCRARVLRAAVVAGALVVTAAAPAQSVAQSRTGTSATEPKLGEVDRARLRAARRAGRPRVTVLIAARPDHLAQATTAIRALGGVVEARNARVDYLKVAVPVGRVERASKLAAVEAIDVDGLIPRDDPQVHGAIPPLPQPPPNAGTPRVNPYLPTGDTGAAQFVDENPHFDGRGTTIAILDSGIDLDHPDLSQTTDGGGAKVVDWYNANSPTSGDGTWISTLGRVTGSFVTRGATWTAPASGGPYAFGVFAENAQDLAAGEPGGDIDRDGLPAETFGVLQDRTTKEVYVDLDQDRDFTDQDPMLDYKNGLEVQYFGTDNPGTAVVERMAFVVGTGRSEYDPGSNAGSVVNIGISGARHGTHVAGIAAAGPMFGTPAGLPMTGAAPGARLMAVKVCLATPSCTISGALDGMLYAAVNGADVANMSVGTLPALNDGNNAGTELYDRIVDEYDMQIFLSSGNDGPGANTVGDPAVTTRAIAVGASITRATWLANYGIEYGADFGMIPFSSRGPREDGGLKPQVTAPGAAVATAPRWQGGGSPGSFALPPGYAMLNGTSMAAPQAAGAAALLVGAYRFEFGEAPTAAALRSAIVSSADFRPGIDAYAQGAGQIDVAAAWERLRKAEPIPPYRITSSVPIRTVLSDRLRPPDVGVGIHDREGVTTGQRYTRTYTLTRTSGPDAVRRLAVSWLGNDGTFAAAEHVDLALNDPTPFAVTVDPAAPGIHSATLRLDDPGTDGVDLMTLNTVFAPHAASEGTVTVSGTVRRAESEHILVRVPPGASALRVDMAGGGPAAADGQLRFLRYTPEGLRADANSIFNCYNPDAGGGCEGGTPTSRTVIDPEPGVWEIVVDARRSSSALEAPFMVTATVLAADIEPNPDDLTSQVVGPIDRTYSVRNTGAPFTGRLVGSPLVSTQRRRPTIGHQARESFDLTLPAGVTSFNVKIDNPSDPAADLDLTVQRCSTPETCVNVGVSGGSTSTEQVVLANPPAAAYRILVDGYSVPSGSTEYDVVDAYASPALGEITASDPEATRASGATWTAPATIAPGEDPGPGRRLTGQVSVVTDAGIHLGRVPVSFRVDTDPPETTITAGPAGLSNERRPTFAFASDEPRSTFSCTVDGEAVADCASPLTTASLADGEHEFAVTAIDPAGNEDASAATRAFAVDATAPVTRITAGPAPIGTDRTPTVAFSVSEPDVSTACRVDAGAFVPCTSPFTPPALADGAGHSVAVRATDAAANTGPAATVTFVVTAPSALSARAVQLIAAGTRERAAPVATLTNGRTGAPVVGRVVAFSAGGWPICSATTDAAGRATCSALLPVSALLLGDTYTATFAGEPRFAAAAARAALVGVAGPPDVTPPDPCPAPRKLTLRVKRGKGAGLRVRQSLRGARIVRAHLRRGGRSMRKLRTKGLRVKVNLSGLRPGRYTVRVTVRLKSGRRVTESRRVRAC